MRKRDKTNRGGAAKGDNPSGQIGGRSDSDDRQAQLLVPSYKTRDIRINKIKVIGERRALDSEAVRNLADSIRKLGLRTPITVRRKNGTTRLVTGLHRLEAAKMLGWRTIPCLVIRGGKTVARLWEIAENLHRAELTALERDKMVAEWVRLIEKYQKRISGQKVQKRRQRGRPEGGISDAARQLPVKGRSEAAKRKTIERALRVANLSQEAIVAVEAAGLDDNRSALLEIAKEVTPEAQIAKVRTIAGRRRNHREAKRVKGAVHPSAASDLDVVFNPPVVLAQTDPDTAFAALCKAWDASDVKIAWESAPTSARSRFAAEVLGIALGEAIGSTSE